MFNFTSSKSQILFNPRMDQESRLLAEKLLPLEGSFSEHFWLTTSGTTAKNPSEKKWVALSKNAVLASAKAVNAHLQSNTHDIWLHTLPDFHVGGLGIWARAYLSKAHVVDMKINSPKWSPQYFCAFAQSHSCTLSALVPTQVYDLLVHDLIPPPSLRAIVVGGGALSPTLFEKAVKKGWPLMPSFGMTECSSQVATAKLNSDQLTLLSHIEAKSDANGYICLKSPSLLTAYAKVSPKGTHLYDPKKEGWFTTEDKGVCDDRSTLKLVGRGTHFIKIGGESVNLLQLENLLEETRLQLGCKYDIALIPEQDERLGHIIHLLTTHSDSALLVDAFNKKVMPFERIRSTIVVNEIPRTSKGTVCLRLIEACSCNTMVM